MARNPIVLIHGYSDQGASFRVWEQIIEQTQGVPATTLHIANYISLSNEVTIKDLAEGFDRALHIDFGLNADEDFERQIFAKTNIAEALDKDLTRPSWKGESVAIGTATDAYQPIEGHLRLTRACLEALIRHRNPATVVTKSRLVARDIDLWLELSRVADVRVYFTITTLDHEIWKTAEPGTPNPTARLETLRTVSAAGVPTGVLMAPVLPGITDSEKSIFGVAQAVADAGATTFAVLPLRLDPFVREHYYSWIAKAYPELMGRYAKSFHNRHTSHAYQDRIKAISEEARERFGLNERRMRGTVERPRGVGMVQLALVS